MNITEKEAIELAKKIMSDINFDYDKKGPIKATFDEGKNILPEIDTWNISFSYGLEDFGKYVRAHLCIVDKEKRAVDISFRNGSITLGHDEEKDKYFIKEKRP